MRWYDLLYLTGDCGREIHYHHIYLLFVLKVSQLSLGKLKGVDISMALAFALMHLLFLTFFLQIVVFIFQGERTRSTSNEEYP